MSQIYFIGIHVICERNRKTSLERIESSIKGVELAARKHMDFSYKVICT